MLIDRSKAALLALAIEFNSGSESSLIEDTDLMSIEGIDIPLALELNQSGITNREDLAEQSVDELIDLISVDPKKAAELIMKARAHWFEED